MPSYPLSFPTALAPYKVRVSRRTAAAVAESPFDFSQQVYQHPGERWEIELSFEPMNRTDAAAFTQFLYDLKGRVGTFAFNLTPHCPGLSPAPGVVNFRLAESVIGWDSELATAFGFSFRATEAL